MNLGPRAIASVVGWAGALACLGAPGCALYSPAPDDVALASAEEPPFADEYRLARDNERRGAFAQAEKTYAAILEQDPRQVAARHRLGVALARQGRLEEASRHLQQAASAASPAADLLNDLGYTLLLTKQWVSAETHFRAALQRDPQYQNARNNLGLVLGQQGRYDEALEEFRRAVGEPEALVNLGRLQAAAGKNDLARDSFGRALRAAPGFPAAVEGLRALGEGVEGVADVQPSDRASDPSVDTPGATSGGDFRAAPRGGDQAADNAPAANHKRAANAVAPGEQHTPGDARELPLLEAPTNVPAAPADNAPLVEANAREIPLPDPLAAVVESGEATDPAPNTTGANEGGFSEAAEPSARLRSLLGTAAPPPGESPRDFQPVEPAAPTPRRPAPAPGETPGAAMNPVFAPGSSERLDDAKSPLDPGLFRLPPIEPRREAAPPAEFAPQALSTPTWRDDVLPPGRVAPRADAPWRRDTLPTSRLSGRPAPDWDAAPPRPRHEAFAGQPYPPPGDNRFPPRETHPPRIGAPPREAPSSSPAPDRAPLANAAGQQPSPKQTAEPEAPPKRWLLDPRRYFSASRAGKAPRPPAKTDAARPPAKGIADARGEVRSKSSAGTDVDNFLAGLPPGGPTSPALGAAEPNAPRAAMEMAPKYEEVEMRRAPPLTQAATPRREDGAPAAAAATDAAEQPASRPAKYEHVAMKQAPRLPAETPSPVEPLPPRSTPRFAPPPLAAAPREALSEEATPEETPHDENPLAEPRVASRPPALETFDRPLKRDEYLPPHARWSGAAPSAPPSGEKTLDAPPTTDTATEQPEELKTAAEQRAYEWQHVSRRAAPRPPEPTKRPAPAPQAEPESPPANRKPVQWSIRG